MGKKEGGTKEERGKRGFPNGKRGGAAAAVETSDSEALIAPIPTKATREWAGVKWYLSAELGMFLSVGVYNIRHSKAPNHCLVIGPIIGFLSEVSNSFLSLAC